MNFCLTLASHTEPDGEAVKTRVRSCFAEFPEKRVAAQLRW